MESELNSKIEQLKMAVDNLEQKLFITNVAKDKDVSDLKAAYKALANALINPVKW